MHYKKNSSPSLIRPFSQPATFLLSGQILDVLRQQNTMKLSLLKDHIFIAVGVALYTLRHVTFAYFGYPVQTLRFSCSQDLIYLNFQSIDFERSLMMVIPKNVQSTLNSSLSRNSTFDVGISTKLDQHIIFPTLNFTLLG